MRVYAKAGITSEGELLEDKLVDHPLEKGLLLEFKKDSDRELLKVFQRFKCLEAGITSVGELLEDELVDRPLEKGLLLEFKKDSDRELLIDHSDEKISAAESLLSDSSDPDEVA
ncbi:ribonuclease II chloroplastic/mitochondrial isoform X1 [Tripterygium wilfordii]|uniref:Ribonuclease II chloroplastic/mitochondrial isoform X1 n=1 Tax=Tripterygium wilfordii TaxID=458696 RepID=A0A7J7DX89_TRIWF|nr:uncharacterized protein LOC119986768 isoform X1 [Tripterygium wilfordii]KAF5750937.1 ribonuclease II chloroplastic/mitochondrial isoform X1 [Tripterygium wilfordii]